MSDDRRPRTYRVGHAGEIRGPDYERVVRGLTEEELEIEIFYNRGERAYQLALIAEHGRRAAQMASGGRVEYQQTPQAAVDHSHVWGDWSSIGVAGMYEKRYCKCGAFQARRLTEEGDDGTTSD